MSQRTSSLKIIAAKLSKSAELLWLKMKRVTKRKFHLKSVQSYPPKLKKTFIGRTIWNMILSQQPKFFQFYNKIMKRSVFNLTNELSIYKRSSQDISFMEMFAIDIIWVQGTEKQFLKFALSSKINLMIWWESWNSNRWQRNLKTKSNKSLLKILQTRSIWTKFQSNTLQCFKNFADNVHNFLTINSKLEKTF